MCITHNQIGCLTDIKSHLSDNGISGFDTLEEIINFRKNYDTLRQNIVLQHTRSIENEKAILDKEIPQSNNLIQQRKTTVEEKLRSKIAQLKHKLTEAKAAQNNIFLSAVNYLKQVFFEIRIWINELLLNPKIAYSVRKESHLLAKKTERFQYIDLHFDSAVNESGAVELKQIDHSKAVIDQVNNSIYGAIGEQLVVKELTKLPNDYVLINDFRCAFKNPIYHSQGNSYISSVQIDHLLITPSGIFLIETKNWSEDSINNLSLHSPVEQVKRTNFALYKILSGEISNASLLLRSHHWGKKKIPVRNLIVMINQKPKEEFQFVKVLTLGQALRHITYFEPIFSGDEIQKITSRLLHLCGKSINN